MSANAVSKTGAGIHGRFGPGEGTAKWRCNRVNQLAGRAFTEFGDAS